MNDQQKILKCQKEGFCVPVANEKEVVTSQLKLGPDLGSPSKTLPLPQDRSVVQSVELGKIASSSAFAAGLVDTWGCKKRRTRPHSVNYKEGNSKCCDKGMTAASLAKASLGHSSNFNDRVCFLCGKASKDGIVFCTGPCLRAFHLSCLHLNPLIQKSYNNGGNQRKHAGHNSGLLKSSGAGPKACESVTGSVQAKPTSALSFENKHYQVLNEGGSLEEDAHAMPKSQSDWKCAECVRGTYVAQYNYHHYQKREGGRGRRGVPREDSFYHFPSPSFVHQLTRHVIFFLSPIYARYVCGYCGLMGVLEEDSESLPHAT